MRPGREEKGKVVKTLEEILAEHRLFKGMDPAHLELIAGCGSNARFNEGENLFRDGEPADHFFLIRHGNVALDIYVPQRGPVTVETVHEGQVVGWSWLFPPYRWHFDARSVALTRVISFDGKCLRGKCDENPEFGYLLMQRFAQVITERLQAARLQLLDMYGHSTET